MHSSLLKLLGFAYFSTLGAFAFHASSFNLDYFHIQAYSYLGTYINPASNAESPSLLSAFRIHYRRFEAAIHEASVNPTDSTVLARLGDNLDEFANLVVQVSLVLYPQISRIICEIFFQNAEIFDVAELSTLRQNLRIMQMDIRLQYEEVLDQSHHGHPTVVEMIHTGHRGRPRVRIDPEFLQWAYAHRSTSGIARFLHVGRRTVRNALLDYGIAEPQDSPFHLSDPDPEDTEVLDEDDLLDPSLPLPANIQIPVNISGASASNSTDQLTRSAVSFTGPLSTLSNDVLDNLILQLRAHFRRAGISMLDGMLRQLGHRLPRDRIRESLMRIDPVQRVFQRIQIRRRVYSVPGPNSLWHHDGQHGLFTMSVFIHKSNLI
jgi:hypothetical protein